MSTNEIEQLREDRDAFKASSDIRGREIERLRARVAELEPNDRRYRWLRSNTYKGVGIDIGAGLEIGETLDEAIDAELAKDGTL